MTGDRIVRFGALGAARITPMALVQPAREVKRAAVMAIAGRQPERAEAFAREHGIPRVHRSYTALIADPEIDAVYIALPNGLHGRWTAAALRAGKHVLCEKPFTANADEAAAVGEVAARTGRVVMEGLHWRYHPLAARMIDVIAWGELGGVARLEASVLFTQHDVRWDPDLAAGGLMDAGCYAVHMVRTLAGAEPEVVTATATERTPGVDASMIAELRFGADRTGRIEAALATTPAATLTVIGTDATLRVRNPIAPQFGHELVVERGSNTRRENLGTSSSFVHQLEAFVAAVLDGKSLLTGPSEALRNMRAIDAIYSAAGLQPRTPTVYRADTD